MGARAGTALERRRAGAWLTAGGFGLAATAAFALALSPSEHLDRFDGIAYLLVLFFGVRAWWRLRSSDRYRLGAEAERQVGRLLERGRPPGYKLRHGVRKRGGGDLDHVLISRSQVIVVETKRSRLDDKAIAQALRHRSHAERRWRRPATVCVCVARGDVRPRQVGEVWVLSAQDLTRWLSAASMTRRG